MATSPVVSPSSFIYHQSPLYIDSQSPRQQSPIIIRPLVSQNPRKNLPPYKGVQNKPNFRKSQMNLTFCKRMFYENKSNWILGENKPKQTQLQTRSAAEIPTGELPGILKPGTKQTQFLIILVSLNGFCIISFRIAGKVMHSMPDYKNFIGDFIKWQMHRKQMQ